MTTHLSLQRMLLPTAQVSSLTTGSITLPGARGAFDETTFQLIQSQSMASSASLSFTSIPQTYTHLQIRGVFNKGATGTPQMNLRINNVTTNSYTGYQYGWYYNGSANELRSWSGGTSGSAIFGPGFWGSLPTLNVAGGWIFNIADYTNSSSRKSLHSTYGYARATNNYEYFMGTQFLNTNDAITRLDIYTSDGSTLGNGSRVSIYGVKSA